MSEEGVRYEREIDDLIGEMEKISNERAKQTAQSLQSCRQVILDINDIVLKCYDVLTPIGKTAQNSSFVDGAVFVLRAIQGYLNGCAEQIDEE